MPVNETIRLGFSQPRGYIETDDTLVNDSPTTMTWDHVPSYSYKPSANQNALEIAFKMGVNAEVCDARLFAVRLNGDIVRVWQGQLTCGTQQDKGHTGHYVDTFSASTDFWITTIKEVDAGGGNHIARLVFDTCGYYAFFVQFEELSSGDRVIALYSGF